MLVNQNNLNLNRMPHVNSISTLKLTRGVEEQYADFIFSGSGLQQTNQGVSQLTNTRLSALHSEPKNDFVMLDRLLEGNMRPSLEYRF